MPPLSQINPRHLFGDFLKSTLIVALVAIFALWLVVLK